jgi:glutaminase
MVKGQMAGSPMSEQQTREERIFFALDVDNDGLIPIDDIIALLKEAGLGEDDPRLAGFFASLRSMQSGNASISFADFVIVLGPSGLLVERALQGTLAIPDFQALGAHVETIFEQTLPLRSGAPADYIPPLREVEPEQFGIGVVSVDGQMFLHGDALVDFSIQSTCKPFNYCFAVEEKGMAYVHDYVGSEPSGRPFNAQVLQDDSRPHNPLINAGAIMSAALIRSEAPVHRRLEHVRTFWSRLTGGTMPRFNAWMAKEETRTGDNNRALAYMMKARQAFPRGEDTVDHEIQDALELYFSTCSLEMNCRELAMAAATLANGGICPVTQERVLQRATVRNCLSLMQMCGMYDYSGEFCFHIGLPAKSGVGGAILLVVPGLMGVCIWSPRLDRVGNSVRGIEVAKRLTQTYRLHLYDSISAAAERIDPRVPLARWRATMVSQALWAASSGDVWTLRRLHEEQLDLGQGDYDQRSPIHLAAAEGHRNAVHFLLDCGIDPNVRDRWGGTPLNDAERGGHTDVVALLRDHGAVLGQEIHETSPQMIHELPAAYGDPNAVVELLFAAAEGDLRGLQRLVASGVPVAAADYDRRTALHLAAAEGREDVARYLLSHGHPLMVQDRWKATPLDEARREGRVELVALLEGAYDDAALNLNVAS